jgi:diketogulonate reductase-like aldo/keto reductase
MTQRNGTSRNAGIAQLDLPDGRSIPVLGQGTWKLGEMPQHAAAEARVLRAGIDLGLTLIDTAEMYGAGGAERVVGKAIAGRRDEVFLVSKILPQNASAAGVARHCEASLRRLGTEIIDLYLLHWEGRHPLAATIAAFEALKAAGKIRYWGVSNFDVDGMQAVAACPDGGNCSTDQVLYHPGERGIEFDLLPWCGRRRMPVMAYCPLGQGGKLLRTAALRAVAERHGASPAQIALAWCLRDGNVIAIPKAADMAHLRENAAAAQIRLSVQDIAEIDAAYPPLKKRQPLAMS